MDDLGFQVPDPRIADELITSLKCKGSALTREYSFTEYLGIQYSCSPDNKIISMTQSVLIQKFLDVTGMEDCNTNSTPVTCDTLGSDPDGEPMEEA